jgi:hypothetical protein
VTKIYRLLLILLCGVLIPVYSQETPPDTGAVPDTAPAADTAAAAAESGAVPAADVPVSGAAESVPDESDTIYYIRNIDFDITGGTKPFALVYVGELKKGEQLKGRQDLEEYVKDKTRILSNQRVLASAEVEYTLGPPEDGMVPVDLLIRVVETLNIIAIPWFEYDSNSGTEFSIRARDYNFLGTMSSLRVNLGYSKDMDGKQEYFTTIDSNIPFMAFGYRWNFDFDNSFTYTFGEPFQYDNKTGISVQLPYRRTTFTAGFEQRFILHEENDDGDKPVYGKYFEDIWYLSSRPYVSWGIPLGLKIGSFGELTYTPSLSETFKYRPGGSMGELRRSPITGLSHSLGFGNIDWVDNFRRGLSVYLSNSNDFNNYTLEWEKGVNLTAEGHLPIFKRFAVSARFMYRQWLDTLYTDSADALRGIKDSWIPPSRYMFSLNMEFPILVKQFYISKSLYVRQFRYFNFDFQASPFIDMAITDQPMEDEEDSFGNFYITGGLELLAFPHSMRSVYLRVSAGFNLANYFKTHYIPAGHNRELFLGFGHFF